MIQSKVATMYMHAYLRDNNITVTATRHQCNLNSKQHHRIHTDNVRVSFITWLVFSVQSV